jgi:hypothetical protein
MPSATTTQQYAKNAFELSGYLSELAKYGSQLSAQDLSTLKAKIYQLEVQQTITVTTGDIYQASDWNIIINRIGNLLRQQSSSWTSVVLGK